MAIPVATAPAPAAATGSSTLEPLSTVVGTPAAPVYGIIGEFDSAADLFHAAEKVRDRGYKRWDVHSPFPIHGMDDAMGLGKSIVSYIVLIGGITGFITAVALQFIPSTITYPLIVQGKPAALADGGLFTVPAFFPIMFELTVLFASFAAVFGMLFMNRLPRWHHPLFHWDRFAKATDDGFFLVIEARDPRYTETGVRELLQGIGAKHITLVHDE